MEHDTLDEVLVEASDETQALRTGMVELREAISATNDIQKAVKGLEGKDPELVGRLQEAKSRAEQRRSELKVQVEKARTLLEEISNHISGYRARANEMARRPLEHGQEYADASRRTIEEHTQVLERVRRRLQDAVNDAANLLSVRIGFSARPSIWRGIIEGVRYLVKELSIPILAEMLFNKAIAIKAGIAGFTIGIPALGGVLVGLMGLSLVINRKEKSEEQPPKALPSPRAVTPPFFPN